LIKSGTEADGDNTGIRHRRIGDSQKPRGDHPVGNVSHSVLGSVIAPLCSRCDCSLPPIRTQIRRSLLFLWTT
jgi:hypothetical protein